MTTEYAGITIIVDQGAKRFILNVPKASYTETRTAQPPRSADVLQQFFDDRNVLIPENVPPFIAFIFRPVGQYTIREETNPMHTPAPELSEHEQAEVDRFGIHDEDDR